MTSTTPGSDPDRPHDADDRAPGHEDERPAEDTGGQEPFADEPYAAEPRADEPAPAAASEPPADEPEPPVEEHPADATPEAEPEPVAAEPAASAPVEREPVAAEPVVAGPVEPEVARSDDTSRLDEAVQRANAAPVASEDVGEAEAPQPVPAGSVRRETYVPAATVAAGSAAGAATLAPEPEPTPAPGPQTIYVQAPNPPRTRGNRGFGALVALVAAAVFALLYAGIAYLLLLGQAADASEATSVWSQFLLRPVFWIPVVATFVGFALLAAIVNRGAWWYYAVFGLLVGALVYLSYIGAALLTVEAWTFTLDQANEFIRGRWLDPFALIAGILAREITIWLGGWVAARGRTVTERNRLAREAYDRELAAGPRPIQP